jgi:hypothetical protein
MPVIPQPDLMLSISLVQIAIRNYKEGKYWRCFQNEIGLDVPVAKLNYIGQIFEKTISKYGLFQIQREENSSHMYVENIKAHAFVTNYYMQGFFDFSYAFYEKNLLRELSENIEDDLKDLSVFMNSTLFYNEDLVYISDKSNKTSKSYKLLKSTRAVLASNEDCLVYNMFYPVLNLIDKYYYENEIPSFSQNRFEKEFVVWCKNQEEQEKHKRTFLSRNRGAYSHKPYIRMNVENESSLLVIPSQKFRSGECEGNAQVIITINGISEIMSMEIYKSFGIYVSEELKVPIPDIFDDVEIIIKAASEHKIHIGKSDYRIFNDSWQNVDKFGYGHNYLLVKKDVEVGLKNFNDLKDSTVEYSLWNYYSLNISDNSIVYVGRKPLSIMGEFSQQPIFDDIIENFDIYYKDKKLTYVTRTHPSISFVVDRERLSGTTIIVNNNKCFLKNIDEKNIYEWKEDNTKVAVNIKLSKILTSEDGYYEVWLDIPKEKNKIICEYFLLKKFDCNLDRKKYILNESGYITIRNGSRILESVNENWNEIYQDEKLQMFKFPITSEKEYAEFNVKIGEEIYKIQLKLEVFKYGFSLSKMISDIIFDYPRCNKCVCLFGRYEKKHILC